MSRLATAIILGLFGFLVLWPSAAIIVWSVLNGGFGGGLQGALLAAIGGPLGGASLMGSLWVLKSSKDRTPSRA